MALDYDFYDFGCSTGGNIAFIKSIFPEIRGLGIDSDEQKISLARANGHEALKWDILALPDLKVVSFVTMAHFLEHLPDLATVNAMIEKGVNLSYDFVHIRQPFMDADGYLLSHGLKLYWSDWSGHRNGMSSLDFFKFLRTLERKKLIGSFAIYARGLIDNSLDHAVIPLEFPINSLAHVSDQGPKREMDFDIPVYREIVVDILIKGGSDEQERHVLLNELHRKMPFVPLYLSSDYPEVLGGDGVQKADLVRNDLK